jgi:tRNA threonylcarbamoyl adenosine modification protein (Sua5/YciO/YrdC/YwlC family)
VTADPGERERGLTMAASVLKRGGVVVIPVEHTYALVANPFTPAAVDALIAAKGRARPLAVPLLVPSAATLDGITHRTPAELRGLLTAFWPGALTVVASCAPSLTWDLGTPGAITARMPLHPVTLDLLRRTGPLAAMTANGPGGQPPTTLDAALDQLGGSIEVGLDGGERPPGPGSTILDLTREPARVLREGDVSMEQLRAVLPDLVGPS